MTPFLGPLSNQENGASSHTPHKDYLSMKLKLTSIPCHIDCSTWITFADIDWSQTDFWMQFLLSTYARFIGMAILQQLLQGCRRKIPFNFQSIQTIPFQSICSHQIICAARAKSSFEKYLRQFDFLFGIGHRFVGFQQLNVGIERTEPESWIAFFDIRITVPWWFDMPRRLQNDYRCHSDFSTPCTDRWLRNSSVWWKAKIL